MKADCNKGQRQVGDTGCRQAWFIGCGKLQLN